MHTIKGMTPASVSDRIRDLRTTVHTAAQRPADYRVIAACEREIAELTTGAAFMAAHMCIFHGDKPNVEQDIIDWSRAAFGMSVS